MKISYVPIGHIAGLVPALLPYLAKSEAWSGGRVSKDDLLRLILTDMVQLWVVHENADIHGFFGLEVKLYPRCKMLTIQYCAMGVQLDFQTKKTMDVCVLMHHP